MPQKPGFQHLLCLLIAIIGFSPGAWGLDEVICGGFDMRNDPGELWTFHSDEAARLKNCTVVEGDVRMVMLTRDNLNASDFIPFPAIREITGFLLLFQVYGLDSLGRIFPNLRVIGGKSLLMNYALIVYQNPNLKEIGLHKLTEISGGGVRITENKELCFTDLTSWAGLCKENELRHIVVRNNKNPDQCDFDCDGVANAENVCWRRTGKDAGPKKPKYWCWNGTVCQESGCFRQEMNETTREMMVVACPGGCYWDGRTKKCCHDQCVGGCEGPADTDCFACRSVFFQDRCLPACPEGLFLVKDRRCVTKQQCWERSPIDTPTGERKHFKPIDGRCTIKCPAEFEEAADDPKKCVRCLGKCLKRCVGGLISSLDDAKDLEGCNIVSSLEIRIQSGLQGNVSAILAKYMKDIVEVRQFVAVSFSEALVSLDMLKPIRLIGGEKLYTDKYAFSVFENENLVRLFEKGHKLQILRGDLQFHNNPVLCYREITNFGRTVNVTLNKEDASARSNGNKAICEDVKIPLKLNVKDNEGFVLSWEDFNISVLEIDERRFLGYQIYYKEVEEGEEPDMFSNRDACHDSWHMVFEGKERGVLINQLKPNRYYAFYVKTVIVHHDEARGGISDIHVYKTDFDAPSQPRLITMRATNDSIFLEWLPPLDPNGDVTHYKVEYVGEREEISQKRDYCENRPEYDDDESDKPLSIGEPSYHNPPGGARKGQSYFGTPKQGHCTQKDCCECKSMEQIKNGSSELPDAKELKMKSEQIQFENTLHNYVFLKNKRARKRDYERLLKRYPELRRQQRTRRDTQQGVFEGFAKRKKREVTQNSGGVNSNGEKTGAPMSNATDAAMSDEKYYQVVTVNVTDTNLLIEGLKHFTLYQIRIWACQNQSAENNYCTRQEVRKLKRTHKNKYGDLIPDRLVETLDTNTTGSYHTLEWKPPVNPNGKIILYELVFKDESNRHELKHCVTHVAFEKAKHKYVIGQLPAGNYSAKVRALSLAGEGNWTDPIYVVVKAPPSVKSWVVIVLCVTIPFVVLILAAAVGWKLHKRNIKKNLPEYIMNMISTNPDYISTLEVYNPDEWELQRDDIEILQEIGEGTFGKVYAGRGKNVRSYCGVNFGDCAVKTVRVTAGHWDRLSFLMEASIMKQFVAAFIVKLYGVVSDGQPALVVMEMMHKGNLRDHLRSRRPDDEENTENLPPPSLHETMQWAGQIADGMAYLESIKFCHRDLAARNCLITHDNCCKIGDFGMTRDLYVKDYYRPTGKRMMPVRWMAPESLKDAKFTSKSDIWSYGVVIWEMATLARQPYPGLSNEEVFSFVVENKKVMDRPTGCPDSLFRIMVETWKYDPRDRPLFAELVTSLIPEMDERFRQISYTCNRDDSFRPASSSRLKNGMRSPSSESQQRPGEGGERSRGNEGNSPNGAVPLAGSVGTDASDFADSDTPLNPAGSEDREAVCLDLQEQDSDGEELQTPVCNSNRRGNMPKSYSTPNWARKSGGVSSNSPRIDPTRSVSNGPIANGHVPPVSV